MLGIIINVSIFVIIKHQQSNNKRTTKQDQYIMTGTELKKLKAKLPRGYRKTLREETKFSFATIDLVLKGNHYNQKIIDAAICLAQKHQQSLKEKSEKISSL